VLARTSMLVGTDAARALAAVREFTGASEQERIAATPCPYGDGHVGPRVASLLLDATTERLLGVTDPGLATSVPNLPGVDR